MHFRAKSLPVLLGVPLVVAILLSACSSFAGNNTQISQSPTCGEVLTSVVNLVRTGDTKGAINSQFDWLGSNCSNEYEIAVDYSAARGTVDQFDPDQCSTLTQHLRAEAMALLGEDGLCTGSPAEALIDAPSWAGGQPGGGIAWNEAVGYAGTSQRVCGPLVDSGSSEDDVFLDLGLSYPDPGRFQIVIWDVGGLEPINYGSTLCLTGAITLYEGVAQIEIYDPGLVEIYS